MSFTTVNPTTGAPLRTYPLTPAAALPGLLKRAAEAQRTWARRSVAERIPVLREAARLLRARKRSYAELMADEMGKPIAQGEGEAEKCAFCCEHFAEMAAAILEDVPAQSGAARTLVCRRPLGVILAIMPWNFPFWQVFRFAAPTLAAGNGVLLKHAPSTAGCGVAIEALLREAGAPEGLLTNVLVDVDAVPGLIAAREIRGVTLTGSTRAGRSVAEHAGRALKKVVLELGGSDPYVILADADLDRAANTCAFSRLLNGGQSCVAAKRFIAVAEVYEAFVDKLVRAMAAKRVGDPRTAGTDVGPMARRDLRDELARQVEASVRMGAVVRFRGEAPPGPGFFYPPTILTDVRPGMPAYDEELFGPVAVCLRAGSEDEALRLADESCYGLGAAIFTADAARGERLLRERVEAGVLAVNTFVASDPRVPFGGVKDSGYGRELGAEGLLEFVNTTTVLSA